MLGFIKKLFGVKDTAPTLPTAQATSKIDTSSMNSMSPVAIPVEVTAEAPAAVVEPAPVPAVEAPVKKPAVKKTQAEKKPVVPKTTTTKATPNKKSIK